jgi:integrase
MVQALPEEIAASRDLGNEWLVPFVVTAYWTGARRNELLRLERRQRDLEAGKIAPPPARRRTRGVGRSICRP